MRDAGDRQHAIKEERTKREENDADLSHDDGDLPVPTTIHSVGAIEESRGLVPPSMLVGKVRGGDSEENDEEDQESAVDWTHKADDHGIDDHRVIAFEASQGRVDGPVVTPRRADVVDQPNDGIRVTSARHVTSVEGGAVQANRLDVADEDPTSSIGGSILGSDSVSVNVAKGHRNCSLQQFIEALITAEYSPPGHRAVRSFAFVRTIGRG